MKYKLKNGIHNHSGDAKVTSYKKYNVPKFPSDV